MGKQQTLTYLIVGMVLGMTSLYTFVLNGSEGQVEHARAQSSPHTAQRALQGKPVSAAGVEARAPARNPADSPASPVAGYTTPPASAGRPLEADGTESTVDLRPFSKAEMFDSKRRELLETGQYAQLDRFEAKFSYEGKRKELRKLKREQLRELDREAGELSSQLAETDDRELRKELRASLKELRSEREEARYAFELEARQVREEFRKVNEN